MPFDPTLTKPDVSRNGVEIGKLRVLSEALKGDMEGWEWNFQHCIQLYNAKCGTMGCAIGLAGKIGLLSRVPAGSAVSYGMISLFGLTKDETRDVFGTVNLYGVDYYRQVTPLMVAREIDRIIASEEAAGC